MVRQAFISRRVVTPEGIRPASILVEDGRIVGIEPVGSSPSDFEVDDFGDDCILPGLVDTHVHINEPGRTEWEGFTTATRAAAAGGYTTLVDMPLNCLPETTTVEALAAKRRAAQGQCWVDWAPWGGVVADNQPHIQSLAQAGVPGYKCFLIYPGCEGFTMIDELQLRSAMPAIAKTGLPLLVHAELAGPIEQAAIRAAGCDWRKYSTYLTSRPDEAELAAIRLLINLCREFGTRIHIVHLATAEALTVLKEARQEGLSITVETCPHYLCFSAEEIPDGETLFKCAPPIRRNQNRERLWQGLKEEIIDLVATDHSPCPPSMKEQGSGDFQKAWGGIASLSVALSAMWTEASQRGFSLNDLAKWMSMKPAQLAGLDRKGSIALGKDADLVVLDPDAQWTVTEDRLFFRHPVSPYVGRNLKGLVKTTFLRGQRVFDQGHFLNEPKGVEQRR